MSTNALEKALWQIGSNQAEAERFIQDPGDYARQFRLDVAEQNALVTLNVGAMAGRQVNTLLLMMAHMAVKGPQGMPEYMRSMNQPQGG